MQGATAGSPIRTMTSVVSVVIALIALALSGCGGLATGGASTHTATRPLQPRLYVTTTYRQTTPPPSADALPVTRLASLDPGDGSIRWQTPGYSMIPFLQARSGAAGDTVYLTSDTLSKPKTPNDYPVASGYLRAMRSSDGHILWKAQVGMLTSAPVATDDAVYASAIVSSGQGKTATRGKWLYALRATDGGQRWKIELSGNDGITDDITLVNGVLYGTSNELCFDSCRAAFLFAVRASDGKLLWNASIPGNLNISTAEIDHGVLFVAVPSFDTSYGETREIAAYDMASGAALWNRNTYIQGYNGAAAPLFVAANGLIYTPLANPVASDPFRPDHWSYSLAALDGHTGALKWQKTTSLFPTIVAHDAQSLYVQTQTATAAGSEASRSLAAYTLADGSRNWQVDVNLNLEMITLQDGALYGLTLDMNAPTKRQIEARSASTGALLWRTSTLALSTASNFFPTSRSTAFLNGALYMALSADSVVALRPADGHVLWSKTFDGQIVGLQAVS